MLATKGNPELPSDLKGIRSLALRGLDDEQSFKASNRPNIKFWLQQVISNREKRNSKSISIQFPNLYKTVIDIIEEVKQSRRSINPQTFDVLAANIFSQLTFALDSESYISDFLVNGIQNELKSCTGIFATDVLGPTAWISPNSYKYLALQIKEYIEKNAKDGRLQLVLGEILGKRIQKACEKVRDLTGIDQSYSLFDNSEDLRWEIGQPKLQFARILLWSKEELLSSIGESNNHNTPSFQRTFILFGYARV